VTPTPSDALALDPGQNMPGGDCGCDVIAIAVQVSVTGVLSTLPHAFDTLTRYAAVGVAGETVTLAFVAPAIGVNPEPPSTYHWYDSGAVPLPVTVRT
jgi:hypothetical protein